MVATGRAEVMIDPVVNLWDAAPLQPIIEEAGGHFTDWHGNPTVHRGEAIATNGLVTEEVLAIVRGGERHELGISGSRIDRYRPQAVLARCPSSADPLYLRFPDIEIDG